MNQNIFKKILLIDDEKPIAETIAAYAKKENMEIVYADNGETGLKIFSEQTFDMVIVDWMLPGMSGLEIIKAIRDKNDVPILMLSARNDETDVVVGLELGADDYMTKPFGPRELMARIHSLFRRSNKTLTEENDVVCGDLVFSFSKKEVLKNGKPVRLTPAEFRILEELYAHRDKVVSREDLMVKALGYHDFLNDRTLDTHIKNLRKKIENSPQDPQIIKTVREAGFKFTFISPL